jgi:hypothetical protein
VEDGNSNTGSVVGYLTAIRVHENAKSNTHSIPTLPLHVTSRKKKSETFC